MKKILVPTDFSPTAEKALRLAINLAQKTKGEVTLYHIHRPVESTFIATPEERKTYNTRQRKNAQKRLQRLKTKVAEALGPVTINTLVGRSPLQEAVLSFADENGVDLIVMGTQGAGGLRKVVIGSAASRIVSESPVPVLLVPEKFDWKVPESIVFATNYALSEINALQLAVHIAQLYETRLTVVHLLATTSAGNAQPKELAAFESYTNRLQEIFSPFPIGSRSIQTRSVKEAMENLHHDIPYDILVMVRRDKTFLQRLFLQSFTKEMCYVTKFPLLIVPAGWQGAVNPDDQAA